MSNTRRAAATRATRHGTATGRRAERQSVPLHQHPAIFPILGLLACLAFLVAAADNRFTVKQVQVVGTNLPAQQIIAASDVSGKNIFRVRAAAVIVRLQSVRQVAVTEVDTQFPDTVIIHAKLRQRFAAWQRGSQLYVVDPDGRVVAQVHATTLPIIIGPAQGDSLGPGVVQAVKYAQSILPAAPYGRIARYEFGPIHGLTIVGQSGWRAITGRGTPTQLDVRIATLAAFLRKSSARAATLKTIDLRQHEPYATTGASTP